MALVFNRGNSALVDPVPASSPIRCSTNGLRSDVLDIGTSLHRNETKSLFLLFSGAVREEVVTVA